MRRIAVVLVFLVSFFGALIAFMPYKKLYNAAIQKEAQRQSISLRYEISRASPLRLYLKNITIVSGNRVIKIQECKIKLKPISFILNGTAAAIIIKAASKEGDFTVKKASNRWIISGMFQTGLVAAFLKGSMASLMSGFNGTDSLNITLTPGKNTLNIDEVKITGDFELIAHGYIKNGTLRLMGTVKMGRIKENFSI